MGSLTPAQARQRLAALGATAFIQASKARRVTANVGTGIFHMPTLAIQWDWTSIVGPQSPRNATIMERMKSGYFGLKKFVTFIL